MSTYKRDKDISVSVICAHMLGHFLKQNKKKINEHIDCRFMTENLCMVWPQSFRESLAFMCAFD